MKKTVKIIAWTTGILTGLMILIIIGLYLFFPIEKVKDMAVEKGTEQLGRKIEIGDAAISIWGGLGVVLKEVKIASPEGEFTNDLLIADEIDVKLQLMPIFSGEYKIDKLIINKPEIYLKKNKNGSNNFSFKNLEKKVPEKIAEKTPDEIKPALAAISFERLEINDGRIEYSDDSSDVSFLLVGLSLSTELKNPQKYILKSSGKLEIESVSYKSESDLPVYALKLEYNAEFDYQKDKLTISKSELQLNDFRFEFEGIVNSLFGEASVEMEVKAEKSRLGNLLSLLPGEYKEKIKDYDVDGEFGTSLVLSYNDKTEKNSLRYSGNIELTDGRINLEEPYESFESVNLGLEFNENYVEVNNFEAKSKSGGLSFNGKFDKLIEYIGAEPAERKNIKASVDADIKGNLNLAYLGKYLPPKGNPELSGEFNFELNLKGLLNNYTTLKPRGKMQIVKASYSDSLLSEPVESFSAQMVITPDTIEIKEMNVAFTSSDASFSGKLINPFPYLLPLDNIDRTSKAKPTFLFKLRSKRFDFDKLFPEVVPGSKESQASVSADSISFILLPDINGQGKFEIDTMIYSKVEFTNISGDIKIFDKKIDCYNVTGKVYSGDVSGSTSIDLNDFEKPQYVGEFNAEQVEVNDFMTRFTKFNEKLYGKIDLKGSYSASGWESEAFLNSLSMNSKTGMKEGKLVTSDKTYKTLSKLAEQIKQPFAQEQPLKNLVTDIIVKDGKVSMSKFKTKLGDFGDLEIDGYYSFTDELSYNGTILLTQEQTEKLLSNKGLLGGLSSLLSSKSTKRIKLPLTIRGTVDKPEISVDFSSIMKNIGENLTKDAGSLLKNLFKKKKD